LMNGLKTNNKQRKKEKWINIFLYFERLNKRDILMRMKYQRNTYLIDNRYNVLIFFSFLLSFWSFEDDDNYN